jgi:hypothetical protein
VEENPGHVPNEGPDLNADRSENMHSVTCPWIFSLPDEYFYSAKRAGKIDTKRRKKWGKS